MSQLCKKFLLLTFIIMLLGWGICLLSSINGIHINENYILYIPFLIGGLSPTISSYIVLKKYKKVASFKEWLKIIFNFKNNIWSYMLVLLVCIIYILPQCIISGYKYANPLYLIFLMLPIMMIGGGLEEAGWRYILQPELEKKYSFTIAIIIVSIIWTLWHLPLFYIEGVGQYGMNYFNFTIRIIGLSFALASIRKVTKSAWLCILAHSIINSLSNIYVVKDSILGSIISTIILIIASYSIIFIYKKNNKGYII